MDTFSSFADELKIRNSAAVATKASDCLASGVAHATIVNTNWLGVVYTSSSGAWDGGGISCGLVHAMLTE